MGGCGLSAETIVALVDRGALSLSFLDALGMESPARLAALIVLAGAGFEASPIPASVAGSATWALAGLLLVGGAMNSLSRSRLERLIWVPVALVLVALTVIVASAG